MYIYFLLKENCPQLEEKTNRVLELKGSAFRGYCRTTSKREIYSILFVFA